jgi:hypothetical protein
MYRKKDFLTMFDIRKQAQEMADKRFNPAYLADKFESNINNYQNSEGLDIEDVFGMEQIRELPRLLSGLMGSYKTQVMQLIAKGESISDPEQRKRYQKTIEKQIAELSKRYEQKILTMLKHTYAEKLETKNEVAKKEAQDRIYTSSIASSERDPEERLAAINDIDRSYLMRPEDPLSIGVG